MVNDHVHIDPPLRVLFVPYTRGVISRGIPLVVLSRMLREDQAKTAFLVPVKGRGVMESLGASVLDIDHSNLGTEMVAYKRFRPHVVVDDCSFTTCYGAKLKRLPRVCIVRTGAFPHATRRSTVARHSLDFQFETLESVRAVGLEQPNGIAEVCAGDMKIVPALPSLEPPSLTCRRRIF